MGNYVNDVHPDELVSVVKKHARLIVLLGLAGLLVGSAYLFMSTPTYSSDMLVFVKLPEARLAKTEVISNLAKGLVSDAAFLSRVAERIEVELSAQELSASLNIEQSGNPEIIRIVVDNPDAGLHLGILRSVYSELARLIPHYIGGSEVMLLRGISEPSKSTPSVFLTLMLSTTLFAGGGLVVALVVSYFSDTIESENDFACHGIPFLGELNLNGRHLSRRMEQLHLIRHYILTMLEANSGIVAVVGPYESSTVPDVVDGLSKSCEEIGLRTLVIDARQFPLRSDNDAALAELAAGSLADASPLSQINSIAVSLRDSVDIVLVYTSGANESALAATVAGKADVVVTLAEKSKTSRHFLRQNASRLALLKSKPLGGILVSTR